MLHPDVHLKPIELSYNELKYLKSWSLNPSGDMVAQVLDGQGCVAGGIALATTVRNAPIGVPAGDPAQHEGHRQVEP